VAIILLMATTAHASIGTVVEATGNPAEVTRGAEHLAVTANSTINSMDVITTGSGTARIRFVDDTRVNITEQSRLVIDDYVYDTRRGDNSRLTLRVGLGTVRYASGQIARINQQRVDIQTPSATIAVRGTDFFMTVDESGQSFVVLVPSCDNNGNCRVGQIDVASPGGTVTLSQAFTATAVTSAALPPTPPVAVTLTERGITNLLIIAPPPEIRNALRTQSSQRHDSQSQESDIQQTTTSSTQQQQEETHSNVVKPTSSRSRIIITDENPGISASRSTSGEGVAWVRFGNGSNGAVTITQGGDPASANVGTGGSNTVIIRQGR